MADYAPHYTARYVLRYSVQGDEHDMQFRWARGAPVSIGDMVSKVATFLNAFAANRYTDWTALSARFYAEDSLVSVPTTVPTLLPGTLATTGRPPSARALFWQFLGRSQAGGRGGMYVYGVSGGVENTSGNLNATDFRLTSAEATTVSNAIAALSTGAPTLAGNDGNGLIWYPYVNIKHNDYWMHQVRS